MLRRGKSSDTARVIELLKNSHEHAQFGTVNGKTGFAFEFRNDYAERLYQKHLVERKAFCLLYEEEKVNGILLAFAYEHEFGPVFIAKETLWWIEPVARGTAAFRMLDSYEKWAFEDQKCTYVGMAGMGEDPLVAALYRRRGYVLAETHYLKRTVK